MIHDKFVPDDHPGGATQETLPSSVILSPHPMAMLARALERGASLEIIERLMDLQDRWEETQARKAFEAAMAEAAKEMPLITKNVEVKFDTRAGGKTSYKHADLAEIVSKVAPILGKHGLSHRFETLTETNYPIKVTCVISHRDGYSIRNTLMGPADTSGAKNPIQAMGSTIAYLSRYTLMAILGLAAAQDDDGQAAAPREPAAKPDVMKRVHDVGSTVTYQAAHEAAVKDGKPRPTSATNAEETPGQSAPASDASGGATADTQKTAGSGKKLTIKQIANLERMAREMANAGSARFDTFWRNCNTLQEREIIKGLGTELRELMAAADKAIIEGAEINDQEADISDKKQYHHDPETGEVIRR